MHRNSQSHRDLIHTDRHAQTHKQKKIMETHRDLGHVHDDISPHHNSSLSFHIIIIISDQQADFSPRYIFISHLNDMSLNTWNMYHPLHCFISFHLKLQTLNVIVFC